MRLALVVERFEAAGGGVESAVWQTATALVTGIGFLMIGLYVALQRERRLTMLFFYLCSGFSMMLLPIAPAEHR